MTTILLIGSNAVAKGRLGVDIKMLNSGTEISAGTILHRGRRQSRPFTSLREPAQTVSINLV